MICINFNINNHTNNNIIGNGNNINSFYFNSKNQIPNNNMNNNIQSERIKKIMQKKSNNIYHSETTNNNSLYLGLNGLTLSHINSPLNRAIRRLIKNNKNNSKIKQKKKHAKTKYIHNNSLVKNLSKAYLSQMKAQKNKIRNKNSNLDIMSLTNKNNSINNQIRRTFSHSFSNKDLINKNLQKRNSKDNVNKELNINQKIHENANTISVNEDLNYRISYKRFNKIPIGRISHRPKKNKFILKNETIETLTQLSKEKKGFKPKIKSTDKYNDKNSDKQKYPIPEIKTNNKNNEINKNISNIIYSKRCMLARKQKQFGSPFQISNSCQKVDKIQSNNVNKLEGRIEGNQIIGRGGSQINIFPKNSNNQIISERIQLNKNKEVEFNDKEEKKTININKDSNISKRSVQKIIPIGITKKIKVNKIVSLNK